MSEKFSANRHETAQLAPEALKRILDTPVPCSELSNVDDTTAKETIKQDYDTQVSESLYPEGPSDVDNTAISTLRDRFFAITQRLNDNPGSKVDDTTFTDKLFFTGAAASLIVANIPNPGDFLKDMRARIPASGQSEDVKKKLANIAQAVYGSRYEAFIKENNDSVDTEFSTAIDESTLEHNKHEDAEILGRSHGLKRFVHDTARKTINNWNMLKTRARNVAASPQLWAREYFYKQASKKSEKKAAKAEKIDPESNSLLNRHRRAVADKYKAEADEKKQKLDTHKDSMSSRLNETQNKTEEKNFAYQERINQYKERKEAAIARKELRDKLKADGASRSERKDILRQIPAEQLQRIGRVACSHNAALTTEKKIESQVRQTGSNIASLEAAHAQKVESENNLLILADDYEKQADSIDGVDIPNVRKLIETHQQEIASLSEDDEQYQKISAILAFNQDREKQLEQKAASLIQRAKDSREEAKSLQIEQKQLLARVAAEKDKLVRDKQRLSSQRSISGVRNTSKQWAINDVINGN